MPHVDCNPISDIDMLAPSGGNQKSRLGGECNITYLNAGSWHNQSRTSGYQHKPNSCSKQLCIINVCFVHLSVVVDHVSTI